jgi:hypothetical protein
MARPMVYGLGVDLPFHEVVLGALVHGVQRQLAVVEAGHDDDRDRAGG